MKWSYPLYLSLLLLSVLNPIGKLLAGTSDIRVDVAEDHMKGADVADSYYTRWRDRFRVNTNFTDYISECSFNFTGYFKNMIEKFTDPFYSIQHDGPTHLEEAWNCKPPSYNPGDSFGNLKAVADFVVWQNSLGHVFYNDTYTNGQFGGDDEFAEEIQDALDDLSSSGGIVYIEDGTYTVCDRIVIPQSNVILSGDGWKTIIRLNETLAWSSGHYIVAGSSVSNVIIKDLTIDGNMGASADTNETSIAGIRPEGCQKLAVLNVNITRVRKHAYGPALSNYTYLINSWLGNNGWNDANPNRNRNASIVGNFITKWRDVGISTWSSIDVYIVNNVIVEPVYDGMGFNTANWGVGVEPGSKWQWDSYNIVIKNNWIEKCSASAGIKGTGIAIGTMDDKRPWNIIIDNNTIRYTKWGIRQWGSEVQPVLHSRIAIRNNDITNNMDGIWLKDSDNNTIFGNTITNNNGHGIALTKSSFNIVSENNITDNNEAGISLSGSENNKVYRNNFIDNSVQATCQVQSHNAWDADYASGGNYWSDHVCVGNPSNGSQPYFIDADNIDRYPFQDPNGWLKVHNVDTGLDYATIQQAIGAFETLDGHTIQVDAGAYYECITIDKALTLLGNGTDLTIINSGEPHDHPLQPVVYVTASNVSISGFTVQNGVDGIRLGGYWQEPVRHCSISGNVMINNSMVGIHLIRCDNTTVDQNIIATSDCGIRLDGSRHNVLSENTLLYNSPNGISLGYFSRGNLIIGNTLSNNSYGLHLVLSDDNEIFHNNFLNNIEHTYVHESFNNSWDNGYPFGGNHWSDYDGADLFSGSYHNETGSDGIGDRAYTIDMYNRDEYPLINPFGSPQPPIASFVYYPKHPVKGERITFDASLTHDRDGFITIYKWDFGDNNVTTVTTPTLTHLYSTQGTYTVNLTVTDNDGFNHSVTKHVTIAATPDTRDNATLDARLVIVVAATLTGTAVATTFLWRRRTTGAVGK